MIGKLVEKETAAIKEAVRVVTEWIRPTTVMKSVGLDCPLDDLGQTIEDLEWQVAPETWN